MRLTSWISVAGLVLALVVHGTTIWNADDAAGLMWPLNFGCIAAVLEARRKVAPNEPFRFYRHLPFWAVATLYATTAYMIWTFFVCDRLTGGGATVVIENGQFILQVHGRVLKQLTEAEYHLHRTYQLRMFSSGWITFYLMGVLTSFFWKE
jgi:hypothetical protein